MKLYVHTMFQFYQAKALLRSKAIIYICIYEQTSVFGSC